MRCIEFIHVRFRSVFDAVIRCLLFAKESTNNTPFQIACKKHGNEKILEVVEDTLIRYSTDTPINIVETLVITAIDTKIHLECVYFLLRRQPDVLVKLLSSTPVVAAAGSNNNNDSNNEGNDDENSSRNESFTIGTLDSRVSQKRRKERDTANEN